MIENGEYTLQETVILTQLNLNIQARDLERMTIISMKATTMTPACTLSSMPKAFLSSLNKSFLGLDNSKKLLAQKAEQKVPVSQKGRSSSIEGGLGEVGLREAP